MAEDSQSESSNGNKEKNGLNGVYIDFNEKSDIQSNTNNKVEKINIYEYNIIIIFICFNI